MAALRLLYVDLVDIPEGRVDHQPAPEPRLRCSSFRGACDYVRRVYLLVLDAPLRAIKGDLESLSGQVGVQGIVEHAPGPVAHQKAHRVLDGDVVPKHVAVADVAVVLLGI